MRRPGTRAFAMISSVVMIFAGAWAGTSEATSRGAFSESAQFLPITDVFAEDEARAGWSVDADGPTAVLGAPLADVVDISLQSDAGVVFVQVFDGFSWTQQRRLVSDDPDADDRFGWAVGISGDTVVVGAPQDDDAGLDAGAVHVFVRTGSTWSEQAKLTAGDASAFDLFGKAVAIDGDTVVVGAQEDDNGNGANAGAVYVFVRSGTVWSQHAKLVPSDATAGIQFGNAVSMDDNTLIAGCEFDNDLGVGSGSAYIYYRIGISWVFQGKLTASDGAAYDNFGASVAVTSTRAVVGAPLNDDFGNDSGSAYVFLKSGSSWTQERKLTASDAAASEEFGRSVAMDGSWVAVGAQYNTVGPPPGFYGSVYAFTRTGPSLEWTETDRMSPTGAVGFDMFGHAVAVSGNRIIGGWPMDDRDGGTNVGSAAVFYRSGVTWPEQAQLYPDDAAAGDRFGYSVSLDGDTAAVGSRGDDHGGARDAGSVSVFENSGGSWAFQQRLFAGDASADAGFGSVAVSGDVMIVGAGGDDDNGIQAGAAYAFLRTGSTWTQQDKMAASDGAEYDHFGYAVDIDANIAVIGAYGGDIGPDSSGVAYVFSGTGSSWTEDAELVPPDPAHGDYFGVTVAVSGTTIAVGAPQDDGHGSLSGSVYIYVRMGSVWYFHSKLTASDADDYDRFGWSVAISGDTLLVGAYNDEAVTPSGGSAYVFTRSGGTWSEQAKLLGSSYTGGDNFGMGVALEGDTAAVGARYHDVGPGYLEGAVFIFERDGGVWTEQQIVTTSDHSSLDSFGQVVSVSPTVLVGGAQRREMNDTPYVGAAYVFDRTLDCNLFVIKDDGLSSVTAGQEITYTIVAGNEGSGDAFGSTITDHFPADLIDCSWTCFVGGGATCTPGPVSGDIIDSPDLPVGGEATYTATCTVGPAAAGTISNTVTVAPPPGVIDSDPSDNTATDLDSVIGQADLGINKDDGLTEVWAGQELTYTIVASNPTGPEDAMGAVVEDLFPPALSDCSWTCVGSAGGSCSAGPVIGDIDDIVDLPVGAEVTYTATCTALAGGKAGSKDHTPDPSVVNLPGSFQDELGCPGDWMPDCATTYLSYDTEDAVWQGTFSIPAGSWEYKAALNGSWLENYGLNATPGGPNISFTVGAPTDVKFYYDHETHWITDDVNSPITVAIGDFQQALGCSIDTDPGCLRSWLQDPDGDEVFELVTTGIPPGFYGVRVAIGESMSTVYGAGGVLGGPEIPFAVATEGQEVRLSFDWATKVLTVDISDPLGTNLVNEATVTAVGLSDPDPSNNTAADSDLVVIPEYDFGDAPDPTYPTLLASGGASHVIVPGMYIGATVDADADGQPTAAADGDDTDGSDDEDLFGAMPVVIAGEVVLVPMQVSGGGYGYAWIDTNHDGDWDDALDLMFNNVWLTTGTTEVPILVAPGAVPGFTTARLRFSSQMDLGPSGPAPDGEVEDYQFEIVAQADLVIDKDNGQLSSAPGEVVNYTILVTNNGPSSAPGSTVTDNFPPELTGCTWTCVPFSDASCTPSGAGDINDSVHLGAGGALTYTVQCTVAQNAVGSLTNTATVTAPMGIPDPVLSNNAATDIDTLTRVADLSVLKDNQRREIVETHRTTYAIWVFNPGPSDVVDAHVSDAFPPELTDCQWACVYVPPGGGCTAGPVTGDVDDLVTIPSGDFIVYAASCTVAAASGTCSNTATVAPPAGTIDPDPSDNSSTDSDHITALADFIFEDGFDEGSTTAWSTTVPPIVLREVVREVLPDQHRAAFRLDLEALEPLGRFDAPVAAGYTSAKEPVFVLMLRRDEEGFAVRARVWSDDGSSETTEWVTLPSPVDDVELRWVRSLPGLENGRAELYVDGLAPAVIDAVDNDERALVESVVAVRMDGVPVTTGRMVGAERGKREHPID